MATDRNRQLVASVTLADCDVQTFRAGGKGGQNQNKRETGVRIVHHASGARGESREQRSQLQNKRTAFLRMIETAEFQLWLRLEAGHHESLESEVNRVVDDHMQPSKLRVEVREGQRWTVSDGE